jgi:4-amino-4-deoxy-L-arabinose transferase-like glycosyltransferase
MTRIGSSAVAETSIARTRAARLIVVMGIAWGLSLPLLDVLAYPDRISVLPNLQTDASTYHAIGLELATTGSLDALPSRHPPGWVSILGAVYAVAGPSFVAAKLVSWAALLASVAMCWHLARAMHGALAGWIAAIVCAWSPALRGYVGTLQYEVITGTALLAVLVLALRAVQASSRAAVWRAAALAGLAGALLVLTRETFLVIVPLVALWIAHRVDRSLGRRTAVGAAVLVVSVTLAPAALWSAVQSYRHNAWITISEKGPLVVELGNNPLANGTYNAPLVGIGQPTGLAFVRAYPGRTVVLAGRKMLYFWGVLRDGWNVPRPAAVWLWRATTGLVPLNVLTAIARGGWLLVLFLVALALLGRDGRRAWWIFPAVVLTLMAVHVAVLSSHRFAVPILPVVFILISGPLAAAVRAWAPAVRSPMVGGALLALGLVMGAMQFQAWPLSVQYNAADLDGLEADNVVDAVSRRPSRFGDARRGVRPIALMPDEYLPAGALTLELSARQTTTGPIARIAVMRVVLSELDGRVACVRDVTSDELPADRLTTIALPCRLSRDTAATLAVFSLGVTDLAVDAVALRWTGR